jgi:DNA-3-methyladenine glycosylase II
MHSQFPQLIGHLYPTPPYDFSLMTNLLGRYTHPVMEFVHDNAYWRTLHHTGGLVMVRVISIGTVDKPQLQVWAMSADVAINTDELLSQVGYILCIDLNYAPFYEFAKVHPPLWSVVEPLIGLHWLRTQTAFEALMHTIIEQQIAWVTAQKAQRWLVQWGNNKLEANGFTGYAFPTPSQIAGATVDEFTPLKITFRRMALMISIAQNIITDNLPLENILQMPPQEAYTFLVGIKGIGHWTASWTLQRTLAIHNVVGHNDVALQAAVGRYFFGIEGKVSPQAVIDTFATFGDYAALSANYTIMRWILDKY